MASRMILGCVVILTSVFLVVKFIRAVIENMKKHRGQEETSETFDTRMRAYAQTRALSKYPDETDAEFKARVFAANKRKEKQNV